VIHNNTGNLRFSQDKLNSSRVYKGNLNSSRISKGDISSSRISQVKVSSPRVNIGRKYNFDKKRTSINRISPNKIVNSRNPLRTTSYIVRNPPIRSHNGFLRSSYNSPVSTF